MIDTSDEITAGYIVECLKRSGDPAVVVVDYLQLLDQRRSTPELGEQIAALAAFVRRTGAICVVISQIDRSFDLSGREMPEVGDIRLPNPLDLSVFDRICFLHDGQVQVHPRA